MTHGTPSESEITGHYIQFQSEVLRQLPRPNEIDQELRRRWMADRAGLQSALRTALCVTDDEALLMDCGIVVHMHANNHGSLPTELLRWKHVGFDSFIDSFSGRKRDQGNLTRLETTRECTAAEAFVALRPNEGCHLADVYEILEQQADGGSGILTVALNRPNYFFVSNDREAYFVEVTRYKESGKRLWGLNKIPVGAVRRCIERARPIFTR